jgi:hypothetical protein
VSVSIHIFEWARSSSVTSITYWKVIEKKQDFVRQFRPES